MRLFCSTLAGLIFLLAGCATMEIKSTSLEREYNAHSSFVYNAVREILEEEKIPVSILDAGEPRIITTDFVETKKLNRYQRYRFKIVIAELSEELTKIKISSFQEYFDDFWKKEWLPMEPATRAEAALFNKISEYLEKELAE